MKKSMIMTLISCSLMIGVIFSIVSNSNTFDASRNALNTSNEDILQPKTVGSIDYDEIYTGDAMGKVDIALNDDQIVLAYIPYSDSNKLFFASSEDSFTPKALTLNNTKYYVSAPHILMLPNGTIIIGTWHNYHLFLYSSSSNFKNFIDIQVHGGNASLQVTENWAMTCDAKNNVYIASSESLVGYRGIAIYNLTDWSRSYIPNSAQNYYFQDPDIAVDSTRQIHVVWAHCDYTGGQTRDIEYARSGTNYTKISIDTTSTNSLNNPAIAIADNNTVYIYYSSSGTHTVYLCNSIDSFSQKTSLATTIDYGCTDEKAFSLLDNGTLFCSYSLGYSNGLL